MSPFARRAVLRGPPWLERLRHRPGRWRLYRLRQALYRLDTPRPTLAACPGEDGASGGAHVAGDLAQSDAGSEGGFELLPRFSGSLATRVRLNVKSSASDCKPQASRRSHGTRTISASRGPQRKCRKSIPSGKKFFKFLRTSLRAFRRRTVDLKGGSTALNRATRPKDDQNERLGINPILEKSKLQEFTDGARQQQTFNKPKFWGVDAYPRSFFPLLDL